MAASSSGRPPRSTWAWTYQATKTSSRRMSARSSGPRRWSSGACGWARATLPIQSSQRPERVLAHDGILVPRQRFQDRPPRPVARVAQGHREPPQEAAALGPLHRTAPEALPERGLVEAGQLLQRRGVESRTRLEGRATLTEALAVPGTDVLADVAAEDVAAEPLAPVFRDSALDLDGQVADAARGVEDVRRGECLGGARLEAGRAAAAHVGPWPVGGQLQVGHDLAQEEPRAVLGMEEARVLAPRPEAGGRRPGPLDDRPGVGVGPARNRPRLFPQAVHEAVEHRLQHVVVVITPGVARDPAAVARRLDGVGVRRVVLHSDRDQRAGPGEGRAQVAAPRHLRREIRHLAGVPPRHPRGEGRELGRGVGAGHPDEVEARFPRQRLRPERQRVGVHQGRTGIVRGPAHRKNSPPSWTTLSSSPWWAPREKTARALPPRHEHSKRPVPSFMPASVMPSSVPSSSTARTSPFVESMRRVSTSKAGPSTATGMRWAPSSMNAPSSAKTRRDFRWRSEGAWMMGNPPTRQVPSGRTRTPSGGCQKLTTCSLFLDLAEAQAAFRALFGAGRQLDAARRAARIGPGLESGLHRVEKVRLVGTREEGGQLAQGSARVLVAHQQAEARRRRTWVFGALVQAELDGRLAQTFRQRHENGGLVGGENGPQAGEVGVLGRLWLRRARARRRGVVLVAPAVFQGAPAVGAHGNLRPVFLAALAADPHVHGKGPSECHYNR